MGRVRVKKRLCRKDSFMGPSKLQQTRIDLGRATEASAVWSTGHALNLLVSLITDRHVDNMDKQWTK